MRWPLEDEEAAAWAALRAAFGETGSEVSADRPEKEPPLAASPLLRSTRYVRAIHLAT